MPTPTFETYAYASPNSYACSQAQAQTQTHAHAHANTQATAQATAQDKLTASPSRNSTRSTPLFKLFISHTSTDLL